MRKMLTALATTLFLLLATVGTAQAVWGPRNNCYLSANELHHCYSIESWHQAGYPREYSDGVVQYVKTDTLNVPNGFVDNEIWAAFPGYENYIEIGQSGGAGWGCCTPHWFFASTKNGQQYAYTSPGTMPMGRYNYYEMFDPCHCGQWGFYVENAGLVKTDYGYPAFTNGMDGGAEAGTNTQPVNSGRDQVAAVEPPPEVWTAWISGYGVHSNPVVDPGMCWARNPDAAYWGNILFSVCGNLHPSAIGGEPETTAGTPTPPPSEGAASAETYSESTLPEMTGPVATEKATKIAKTLGAVDSAQPVSRMRGAFEQTQRVVDVAKPDETTSIEPQMQPSPQGAEARIAQSGTYLVVFHGKFTNKQRSVPYGRSAITGSVLGLILQARPPYHAIGRYIGNETPTASGLSTVKAGE